MGRLDGKVAVISGAARGQGRSHAVTLAGEGASIVAFDICEALPSVITPGATEEDLAETLRLVEDQDQRCLTSKTDARDLGALTELADRAMGEFGRIDIALVNHGLWHVSPSTWEIDEDAWQESIEVMLTGAWKVAKAFIPKILEGERGVEWQPPESISNAILYLVSDDGAYTTGVALPVDSGWSIY